MYGSRSDSRHKLVFACRLFYLSSSYKRIKSNKRGEGVGRARGPKRAASQKIEGLIVRVCIISETGRGRRIRTLDPRFWRPMLYQLSYTPKCLLGRCITETLVGCHPQKSWELLILRQNSLFLGPNPSEQAYFPIAAGYKSVYNI
jgi:hypothetical protein